MGAIESIEWEACLLEPRRDRELERSLRRELSGTSPSPLLAYTSDCPWLARSAIALDPRRSCLVHFGAVFADVIGLVVSQDNSCRFCYAAQRVSLRLQGYSERRIRELEGDLLAARLEPRERTALEFARRISRCSPQPTAADRTALREAGWSDEAIKELAFTVAAAVYFNRLSTLLAIPVATVERIARTRLLGPLAPLLRRVVLGREVRGERMTLAPELHAGAYAPLVLALDGLPTARVLRQIIDGALASPALPRRLKALIFAIVARGLGCPRSEDEALRLLAAEGVDRAEAEARLAHLGGAGADPVEATVLTFARETIRYQPARVQRRARELRERLGRAELVDTIGTAALANAVCRLWIALESK
jgi:AhpD family alkylhydroperoxidase